MAFVVNEEYYDSVIEMYINNIEKVETYLDDFKTACDSLYSNNNFGSCLQEVLQEIYCNFYTMISGKLTELISNVEVETSAFVSSVAENDNF